MTIFPIDFILLTLVFILFHLSIVAFVLSLIALSLSRKRLRKEGIHNETRKDND